MGILQSDLGALKQIADNSITIALLILGVWLMWKRDERYRKKQEDKMAETEKRINEYIDVDRKRTDEMLNHAISIQDQTNIIMKENADVLKQTNRILECFTDEMLEFKSHPMYREYLQTRTTSLRKR